MLLVKKVPYTQLFMCFAKNYSKCELYSKDKGNWHCSWYIQSRNCINTGDFSYGRYEVA